MGIPSLISLVSAVARADKPDISRVRVSVETCPTLMLSKGLHPERGGPMVHLLRPESVAGIVAPFSNTGSPNDLANLCQARYLGEMSTMNISLPEALKSFVDQQVSGRGFGTSSEYIRELIRKDQDRQNLRRLLLDGATSAPMVIVNDTYFDDLRERIRRRAPT